MSHAVILDAADGAGHDIDADILVAVYAAAGFRTALDARAALARAQGGVVVDDADALAADRLKDALAHRGFAAHVVPLSALTLAHPQRTKELVIHTDHVDLADSLGRLVRRERAELALLAAGATKIVTTQAGSPREQKASGLASMAQTAASVVLPGAKSIMNVKGALEKLREAPLSTQSVEVDEVFVDVAFVDPLDRLTRVRVDERGLILRAGGPRSLSEWAAKLDTFAPPSTTRQRGFVALARGARPPALKNLRDYDREVAACLWRRQRASGA